VRGLTREEREVLRQLARPGEDAIEIGDEDVPIREQLTERGLLSYREEVEADDEYETVYDVWEISETGRLALRVCT